MLGVVAVELELHVRRAKLLLQLVDAADRERLVLGAPVTEQRHLDLRGVDVLERRVALPDDARGPFRPLDRCKNGERAAPAKAGRAALRAAAPLQVQHPAPRALS